MSDVAVVERLVAELTASGTLSPEMIDDLGRFVSDARAGTLWEDDRAYLAALHAKILAPGVAAEPDPDLAEELPGADDWKRRAERAEARLEALEQPATGDDAKFHEIKRRFALRYDPNSGSGAGDEPATRAGLFAEFWPEFEAVEKGR